MMKEQERSLSSLRDIDWKSWTPTEVATLVFVVRDENVLLIRKKTGLGKGKILGPGGRLEQGESIRECAVRELQEELHITPSGLSEGGQLRFQFTTGYGLHVHVFVAQGFEGEPTETEEAQPFWYRIEDIPYHEMWPDDPYWLPLLFRGTPFAGRFLFEEERMLDHRVERWPVS